MAGKRVFRTYVNDAFKWKETGDERPRFGSVFIGSNDFGKIRSFDEIVAQLRVLQEEFPLVLVSPIGGMGFLAFLSELRFERVLLADDNVAEHAKAAALINRLLESPYETFRGFDDLERALAEDPALLLPRLAAGCHTFEFGPSASFSFEGRAAPAVPIFPLSRYPEFRWRPDREQFERAKENLGRALSERIFLRFPTVDDRASVVVYFLSNIDPKTLPTAAVLALGRNTALALPVRAHRHANDDALHPHLIWEACAKRLLASPSLHVWTEEDRRHVGTQEDRITDASCLLDGLPGRLGGGVEYDSVLFHMHLSKCVDAGLEERRTRLAVALKAAGRAARRLLVAEFAAGTRPGRPERFGMEEMAAWVDTQVGGLGLRRRRHMWVPGGGIVKRSYLLEYAR